MPLTTYVKVFDSVKSSAVVQALKRPGTDKPYIKVLQDDKDGTATIKLRKEGDNIPVKRGVRQGDTIFLELFAVVQRKYKKWDGIMNRIEKNLVVGMTINMK